MDTSTNLKSVMVLLIDVFSSFILENDLSASADVMGSAAMISHSAAIKGSDIVLAHW